MRRGAALLALFVALSVLHTWPLAGDIGGLSRLDNDDTGLNVFVVSWVAHVLPTDPLNLFNAPIFFPEQRTLAYSEHMLVPSLMGAPLLWAGVDPVVVYNLLVLAGFALSGWTMSLVMRAWTGSTTAGIVSGMLFAFNAHLLTRLPHLQALHVEFLPLALYALDQVLVRTRRLIPAALALAAAFVLQALCSNYTLVFLSAALLVAAIVRLPEWTPNRHRDRALALVAAGALAIVAVAPFLWPYYVVSRDQGLTRTVDEVRLYSAGWLDYLTTGGRLHYAAWSSPFFDGRTPLFPGVLGFVLAVAGLAHREVRQNPRARMMVAIAIVGVALSFGPALPGYAWLHAHVPLLQGIRAAARWGFLMLTAVAMLAGFTVAAWQRVTRHVRLLAGGGAGHLRCSDARGPARADGIHARRARARNLHSAPRQDRCRARRASALCGSQCQRERALSRRRHAPLPAAGEWLQRLRNRGIQAAGESLAGVPGRDGPRRDAGTRRDARDGARARPEPGAGGSRGRGAATAADHR